MNDTALWIGRLFVVVMYFLYWLLVLRLTDTLLEKRRGGRMVRFALAAANMAILLWSSTLVGGSTYSYIILFGLLLLNLWLLYKGTPLKILFCASACIIHVMAIRAFVTGLIAAVMGSSVFEAANLPGLFIASLCVCTTITNIAILLVLKFIPSDKIRIINEHKEQQWFLVAWMSVFNAYLLFNSGVFSEGTYHPSLVGNEMIVSVAILLGLYIVLFFALKTITLLGYKEKSAELQREIYQEQQFRSAAIKDALMTYEINITQDTLTGFEGDDLELGTMTQRYSDMLAFMSHRLIYSEDVERFMLYGSRANLTREFEEGRSETVIEYRRLTEPGKYIWVRAVTNLTQRMEGGDLIAYVLIKDIELEKQHQLSLQFKAERDPMTGLYNKEMTGKLIDEQLLFHHSHMGAALFMVDADNFKEVNDRLGHVFGDAVLCELAEKLQRIFRADDIVGRIGGDEFIAFMREGATPAMVAAKATEICKAFYTSFNGEGGEGFLVTGSVGVSVAPKDGRSFADLYRTADIALYEAKNKGKNTFATYHGSVFAGYQSSRNEIPQVEAVDSGSFRQNRVEYIFKILYQSESPVVAIHSALELVASHFAFERGYIFEVSKDGKTTSNSFEWCADGIAPKMDLLQNIPVDMALPALVRFHEDGIFVMRSLDECTPEYRKLLESLGIKLMIRIGIFDHGRLLGFIGFDNCEGGVMPGDTELDEMKTICNILATFFVKHRIAEDSAENLRALTEMMNSFEKFIYVIDPKNYKVLFMNEKMRELMSYANASEPCYSFFRGNDAPCHDCPLNSLADDPMQQAAIEIYNEKHQMWLEANFNYLRWTDGRTACMITCMDVTERRVELPRD